MAYNAQKPLGQDGILPLEIKYSSSAVTREGRPCQNLFW